MKTSEKVKERNRLYYDAHKEKWVYDTEEKKARHREANVKYVQTHPDDKKKRYERNKDEILAKQHKYYEENKETIREQHKEYREKHREHLAAKSAEAQRKRNQKLKELFVSMYGGKCECCGEAEVTFLSIDHINGQIGIKKKEGGARAYKNATESFDPQKYRVLCLNCNSAVRFGRTCPHQLKNNDSKERDLK